jgi:putative glycerol-1-phosphate prenyltransferase
MKFSNWIKALEDSKEAGLAVLIDPDKYNVQLVELCNTLPVRCFFVGGSKLETGDSHKTVSDIKKRSKLPVVLFPGDTSQITKAADGMLVLSLLSGRNAEYLIGQQVRNAAVIEKYKLPTYPVAYILVAGKHTSTTQQVTQTKAIAQDNYSELLNTCLAAQNLGFRAIYLEAGSGAKESIKARVLKKLKTKIKLPFIVGGGISTVKKVQELKAAGANIIVVGNALEKNVYLVRDLAKCFKSR